MVINVRHQTGLGVCVLRPELLFKKTGYKLPFVRIQIIQCRPLVKSAYQKIIFLLSQPKHMLWVLKRTVSVRRFF